MRRLFDWTFRDRRTGRIVVAQAPNLPLGLFIVAAVVGRIARLNGGVGTVVRTLAVGSLLWWAVDEIVRGVNPFRRALGATVGVVTVVGLVTR